MPLYVLHDKGEFYCKKTKLTIGAFALNVNKLKIF